jgi:glucose/mannose-6-phosphate isomerase
VTVAAVSADGVLDDSAAIAKLDREDMLRAVATAGAQIRSAASAMASCDLTSVTADGRPRAVVMAGMGGSGVVGDVLAAVAGSACPVPLTSCRDHRLPGWVGPLDLVVAISCSGSTAETLALVTQAQRRGCRLLTVGVADSPLAELSAQARGVHLAVDAGDRMPRANLWALSVPVLVAADRLGIARVPAAALDAAADTLDDISDRCRPTSESFVNPGKGLALAMAEAIPVIWGAGQLGGTAATRFANQLAENAKQPAVAGTMPEVLHNQIVSFDGPFVSPSPRIHLTLLRDPGQGRLDQQVAAVARIAEERGVPTSELTAVGDHPLIRLASLVGIADFASVYLALAHNVDPSPISAIADLKAQGPA